MKYSILEKYCFPFKGNGNVDQFLKSAEAYHPLDYLTFIIIDHIENQLQHSEGPIKHILERLISWIERNILGKARKFDELQHLLYAQSKSSEHAPKGIAELIESMIPYRYYEALSGDEIDYIKETVTKIYKDGINAAFSMAMDKPSLIPTQSYEINESKMPEFKEDYLTPWLQGSEYERI